jgi:hypothetical protein
MLNSINKNIIFILNIIKIKNYYAIYTFKSIKLNKYKLYIVLINKIVKKY